MKKWHPPTFCPNCRREFKKKEMVGYILGDGDCGPYGQDFEVDCLGCGYKGSITDGRDYD